MNIIPFSFESREIRVVEVNGEPWFVAADICKALELGNPSQAVQRLDIDEVSLISNEGRDTNIINESGLYSLILGSRKPEAKTFKKWVTSEVLPSIRKTGGYQLPSIKVPQSFAEALRLAADQAEQIEHQKLVIAIQAPKAEFADRIASADKGVLIGSFAKAVGLGPRTIFQILHDLRVLMKGGNRHNLPYQEYIERGYFEVAERPYDVNDETRLAFTPLITGKGQQWLTQRLIAAGYLTAVASKEVRA